MSKSKLPYSKSQYAKLEKSRPLLTIFVIIGLATALSCQMTSDSNDNSENWFGFLNAHESSDSEGPYIKFIHKANPSDSIIELDASVCHTKKDLPPPFKWRLTIHSPFGQHAASIIYPQTTLSQTADVSIEGRRMTMELTDHPSADHIKQACAAYENKGKSATLMVGDDFVDTVRPWAVEIAPDCRFPDENLNRWQCRLLTADPGMTLKELDSIKAKMIRRWSRQPYLLARRVAISQQLARAMKISSEQDLDTTCMLIRHAQTTELPLVMTSIKWQKATCEGELTDRINAGNIGLAKAVAEIGTFKSLFEKSARLGYFTLRIPSKMLPTKTILVNLKPHRDVKENLIAVIAKNWSTEFNNSLPEFCWHPIFGESGDLNFRARYLGLGTQSGNATCKIGADYKEDYQTLARSYLANSITSETEFVVSNFRSKLLRLPEGNYSFVLHGLPDDPSQWDDANEFGTRSSGDVAWTRRRPNPIIRKW
jgi:hypothetical protein